MLADASFCEQSGALRSPLRRILWLMPCGGSLANRPRPSNARDGDSFNLLSSHLSDGYK